MTRKRGLGKGLDALIPTDAGRNDSPAGILQVDVDAIVPNPHQPRKTFNPIDLKELADSIAAHGVLQPLIVKPVDDTGTHTLIAGERRLQAARQAGLRTVPVIIRDANEQDQLLLALIENLQREDLNPLEAAAGYNHLKEQYKLTHNQIAERIGKSRTAISNSMRLLNLPSVVQDALMSGAISEGHARALLGLPTAQAQAAALKTVLRNELNVRQTEDLVRRLTGERRTSRKPAGRAPELTDLEEQLRQSLGTRVTLKQGRRGGSIIIRYYSDEELNALLERLVGGA